MTKKEIWGVFWLAIGVMLVVASAATHVLDNIVVPIALLVVGVIAFLVLLACVTYGRKYFEDHPYVPYVGRHAHLLCKECARRGHTPGRIEVNVGHAYEGWDTFGYFRGFKRLYRARCNSGHEWTYDPILQQNEIEVVDGRVRQPRSEKARVEGMRQLRRLFHSTYVEPHLHPDLESA